MYSLSLPHDTFITLVQIEGKTELLHMNYNYLHTQSGTQSKNYHQRKGYNT